MLLRGNIFMTASLIGQEATSLTALILSFLPALFLTPILPGLLTPILPLLLTPILPLLLATILPLLLAMILPGLLAMILPFLLTMIGCKRAGKTTKRHCRQSGCKYAYGFHFKLLKKWIGMAFDNAWFGATVASTRLYPNGLQQNPLKCNHM